MGVQKLEHTHLAQGVRPRVVAAQGGSGNGGILLAPMDFATFRTQEDVLIRLNLLALGALLLIDLGFRPFVDALHSPWPPLLFSVRMIEQLAELRLLNRRKEPLRPAQVQLYAHLSIWINFVFAAVVSLASNIADAHYMVLLVLPLIAAGFRFRLLGVAVAVLTAASLTYLEILVFYIHHPPVDPEEIFETTTMVLVFVVVGVMVWLLAERMRADAQHLRTAYEKLHAAQKKLLEEERLAAIGRLASAVAHEIRNPVGMIASALETAHRKDTEMAIREEFCDIAAKESRRLERITTDFLAYARNKPPERAPQPLETTVGYVAGLVAARVAEHKLQLDVRVEPGASGEFDAFQMHQALLNLVSNALDHTPEGGIVILGADETPDAVEIYVENSGAPVACPEDAFEPFFTTKPRGTGLGLSISRKIAEAHGGALELTHNAPGQVRFTLTIPRQQE